MLTRAAMRMLRLVRSVEGGALGALMLLISFGYGANVLVRQAFPRIGPQLAWIEEASLIGLAWMVFFGLAMGLEQGRQIAMTSALALMRDALKKRIKFAINLLGTAFSLYLAKIGYDITMFVSASGQSSPTLGMSMAWLYMAMPVGFALLAIRYALELVGHADRYSAEIDPAGHF